MDENSTARVLKQLYKLENRSVKLGTESEYVQRHIGNIFGESGGAWNRAVAERYIELLKQSI